MGPRINKALQDIAARFDAKGDDDGQSHRREIERLLQEWAVWNTVRAVLVGMGALVGCLTVLGGLYGEGQKWTVNKL